MERDQPVLRWSATALAERSGQFVEQDPGPRGSPQLPHGAGGACENDLAGVLDCAAKTESCFCNSTP